MTASDRNAPLVWRMRGRLQDAFKWIAFGVMLLGAYVSVYALVVGPLETIGIGLTLVVGGALIFVAKARR